MIQRTLFIHRKRGDDGLIRLYGKNYAFHYQSKVVLGGKRMIVWVIEAPYDWQSITERLLVYSEPHANDGTYIGHADWRPS